MLGVIAIAGAIALQIELVLLFLILFELLHLDARLHHVEEVLCEVKEDQRCPLHELNVDHVIG